MPVRPEPFVTDYVYHIYNRGVNRSTIFHSQQNYQRFYDTIDYYRIPTQPVKLSYFLKWSLTDKRKLLETTQRNPKKYVSIYCYAFMPNHFHLLVRQIQENGVSEFMRKVQNSFAKYENIRHERTGGLYEGPFRAIRIKTENQLLHVSRYIHLNPYTSSIVTSLKELHAYPWTSLPQYIAEKKGICETRPILSSFSSSKQYEQFVNDQADYQRELETIKHLALE